MTRQMQVKNGRLTSLQPVRTGLHPATAWLVVLIIIMVGRIQEIIPFLWNLHLAKFGFVIALGLFFLNTSSNNAPLNSSPQIRNMLMLYGLGWISTLFSFWPGRSLDFMLTNFLSVVILTLLLFKTIGTWQELKVIAWGIALTVALLGLSTLLLYNEEGRANLEGTAYDPNDLASAIVVALPMVYYLAKNESGWKRLALLCVGVLALQTVIATHSRGGFIGLVVVFIAILLREKIKPAYMLLIVVLAGSLFTVFAPAEYKDRITSLLNPTQDYNMTAGSGRLAVWKRGIGFMLQYPLTGVGPTAFSVAEGKSHANMGGKWSDAHNSFVQIGTELGIIGLFLFVRMLFFSIKQLRQARQRPGISAQEGNIVSAIELGFYGFIATGVFLSNGYSAMLFLLIGMSSAVFLLANQETSEPLLKETARG